MTQQENPNSTPPTETAKPRAIAALGTESKRFVWLAVLSIILTIASWVACSYSAVAAIVGSAVAIVLGICALRSRRHGVRNTAITSIIAAAVLLVVIAAFCIVIYLGLKSV